MNDKQWIILFTVKRSLIIKDAKKYQNLDTSNLYSRSDTPVVKRRLALQVSLRYIISFVTFPCLGT